MQIECEFCEEELGRCRPSGSGTWIHEYTDEQGREDSRPCECEEIQAFALRMDLSDYDPTA
jgi:hypothetical protein